MKPTTSEDVRVYVVTIAVILIVKIIIVTIFLTFMEKAVQILK